MTKHEAVVISAYTGFLFCKQEELVEYMSQKVGRPLVIKDLPVARAGHADAIMEDVLALNFDGSEPDPKFPPDLHLI